ncbi:MAG: N-acyl homoserine lactonase family protein, partial [Planctomycetes bacterium]|nr:N-acyl homoserine lactonase family protein [Planctomycetota bacterium]
LIEGEKKIIIDTGFESVERTLKVHKQKVWREEEQELPNIFKKIKLRPEDVEIIIFTHLHYDHCGNNRLFPKARFIVQRKELEYAFVPLPGEETAYFSPLIGEKPSFWGTRFELIEGDKEIARGIKVITTPGHTPGCQSILVDTGKGLYCIAGDTAFFYENIEKNIPIGATSSRLDWFSSMEKMKKMSDYIIPGHEPEIFKKIKYPEFP